MTFTGQASCDAGSIVIEWTGTKQSSQLSFDVEITDATVAGTTETGTLESPVTFSPNPLPRLGADVTTGTSEYGGSLTGVYVLTVDYVVTPFEGNPSDRSATVTVAVEEPCLPPASTTVVTTTPASSSTTTSTAASSTTSTTAAVATVRTPTFTG